MANKITRIAVRVDNSMHTFLQTEANSLDISVGQYIRRVVKEKMNVADRTKLPENNKGLEG